MASMPASIAFAAACNVAICRAQTAPAKIESLPLHNFQMVSKGLYRGAEPSAEGFRQLARVGIHTVLDLRAEGGRATLEEQLVRSLGMQYMNVPLAGYQAPTPAQIAVALRILENPLLALFLYIAGAAPTGPGRSWRCIGSFMTIGRISRR